MPSVRHPPSKSPAGSPARGVAPEVDSRRIASTRPPLPGNVNDKRARPHRDAPQPLNGTDASENRDVSSSHRQVAKELQGPTQSAKVDSKRGDPAGGPSVRSTTAPIIPAGTPSKSHAPSPDLRRTPVADPSASSTSTPNGTSKSRPRAVPSAAEQTRHRVPVPATAPRRSAQAGEKEIAKILAGHMENCLTKLDQITEIVHKRKPFTGEDAVRSRAEKDRQKAEANTSSQAAEEKTRPHPVAVGTARDAAVPPRAKEPLPGDSRTISQSAAATKHAPAAAQSRLRPSSGTGTDTDSLASQSNSQVIVTPALIAKQAAKRLQQPSEAAAECDSVPKNALPSSTGGIEAAALSDVEEHSAKSPQATLQAPQTTAQSTHARAAASTNPTPTTKPRPTHAPPGVATAAGSSAARSRAPATTLPVAAKAVAPPLARTNSPTKQNPRLRTIGTQTKPAPLERPPLDPTRSTRDIATSTASAPPSPRSLKEQDLPPSRLGPSEATKRSPQMRRIQSEATSANGVSPDSTTHTAKTDDARSHRTVGQRQLSVSWPLLTETIQVSSGSDSTRSSTPMRKEAPAKPLKRTSSSSSNSTLDRSAQEAHLPPPPSSPTPALPSPPPARTSQQPTPPDAKSVRAASSVHSSKPAGPSKPTAQANGRSSPRLTHPKVANQGTGSKETPRRKVETATDGPDTVKKAKSPNAATPQPRPASISSHRIPRAPDANSAPLPPSVVDAGCGPATPPIQASNTEASSKAGKASSNHVRPSTMANAACASSGVPVKEVAKQLARISKADTVVSDVASIDVVLPPLPPLPAFPNAMTLPSSGARAATRSAKGKERARDLSPEFFSAVPSEGRSVAGAETSRRDAAPHSVLQQSPVATVHETAQLWLDESNIWSESPKLTTAFDRDVEDDDDDDDDNLVYHSVPTYLITNKPLPPAPSRTSSDFALESLKKLNKSAAQLKWQHNSTLRQPKPRLRPLKSALKPGPQEEDSALGELFNVINVAGASDRAVHFNVASPSGSSTTSMPVQQVGESSSSVPSSQSVEDPNDPPPRYSSVVVRAPTRGPLAAASATARTPVNALHHWENSGLFLFRRTSKLLLLRENQRRGGMYTNPHGSRSAASLGTLAPHLGQPLRTTGGPQPGPSAASKLWRKAKNGLGLGGTEEPRIPQVRWVVPAVKTMPPELEIRPEWPREKAPSLLRPKS
ncbi:hypothetical protein TRAPUB_11164 [Trametes pubescens]|uniref:Uncharacterized protein n=1 Tax=Trametes pubescens TaxID=154538 RepID=A0A1M2VXG6_TRAPU|nr:hypothetical protein TRAPUB_11164 [Trametes pubescens]